VYEPHFGLERSPFGESLDPARFIALPSRDAVLRRLRYALERSLGPGLLFGPPGTGKTLLARRIANELVGPTIYIAFPALSADELLNHVAREFGAIPSATGTVSNPLGFLREHLAALAARGRRPLLIVDDAHLLGSASTFDALRLLLNFATRGPADLSLLLVGDADLLMEIPSGFADRIAATCLLGPLIESESLAYVTGKLAVAGAKKPLFSPEALKALHQAAMGSPRRLNRLADMALLIAYAQELLIADAATVAIAAREFHRDIAA
jgi:type II secretory pathway predicted ATPase ExeA